MHLKNILLTLEDNSIKFIVNLIANIEEESLKIIDRRTGETMVVSGFYLTDDDLIFKLVATQSDVTQNIQEVAMKFTDIPDDGVFEVSLIDGPALPSENKSRYEGRFIIFNKL